MLKALNLILLLTTLFLSSLASALNVTFDPFGDAIRDGDQYTWPTGAESWAGYYSWTGSNDNPQDLPAMSFANGGTITFTAALAQSGASADLNFKFERLPHSDFDPNATEPSFYTSMVKVDSTSEKSYTVNIPAQPEANTYTSFLMYLHNRDRTIMIKDVVVEAINNDVGCQFSLNNGVLKIEAECYSSTLGDVQLETTSDTGGGENVGWIDAFDAMIYSVDIPSSGNYQLKYRMASPNGNSQGFNVSVDDQLVDNLSVNATGGWQNWETHIGPVVALTSGQHEFQFDANSGGMNINWFSLTQTNDPVDTPPIDNNDSSNWQPVDSTKWFHQTQMPNAWGWHHGELQHYTDELENSYVSNGTLKIVAKKQNYTDQGVTQQFTSARLNSKFSFKYGKVEFSAKMPYGSGTWPAVWMLNRNITENGGYWANQYGTTPWPASGEIDILEHWGKNPGYAQSAMHTTSSHGGTINHGGQYVNNIFSEFHTYTMEWDATSIRFYVDGQWHYTYNPSVKNADTWPYDDHFYLLLNIAIEPEIISNFTESQMEIDWIRVYHHQTNQLIWSDEFGVGDSDNDGVNDDLDAFPNDPTENLDTDNDGIGNVADTDDDNDGVLDTNDAFPLNSSESLDTDSDGIGNVADTDDDNDGVLDANDAFPLNSSESLDTDNDGIGNVADTDDDNDGVLDANDAFPLDNTESLDTDGDGIGNVADTDDDGDGILDENDSNPLIPDQDVKSQIITIANSPNAVVGGQVSLDISYDSSDDVNALTGLGLAIHYDSSVLQFTNISNLLTTDNIIPGNISEPDDNDLDGNPITDRFVSLAWASIFGNWPGTALPSDLLTINFLVNNSLSTDNVQFTPIDFSSNSNASGYDFLADTYQLQILSTTWDLDNNGHADALTDGLLLLRHSFGLRGESLTNGAIASDSPMSDMEVETSVADAYAIADIDNNGEVDALTDGLMLLRYLFGLKDNSLVGGAVASNAQRTLASEIEQYLIKYMPPEENAIADTTPPVITLSGDQNMGVSFGDSYIEPGATVSDDQDSDIQIEITGTVESEIGTYQLTYSATDAAGNTSSITRTIVVDQVPNITSFSFLMANNPALSNDVILEVGADTITGQIPENISVDQLVASFQHDEGSSITVSSVDQSNGLTANDFTQPLEYRVSKSSGVSKTYSVDVTKFTGLPIVNIITDNFVPIASKDEYVTGTVSVDGGRYISDMDALSIEIRGRGNSTWFYHPKKPYQMKFEGKEEFLDMPKDKKWIFLAEYSDKSLLRNTTAFELGYLSGLDWTPQGEFAEVFINNDYVGTYNITQKVEESGRRVDITNDGFLLEIDQIQRLDEDDVYFSTDSFPVIAIKEPGIDRVDQNDFSFLQDERYIYIRDYVNQFEDVLFSNNFDSTVSGYAAYIDVDSFVDWFLINEIIKNQDARWFSSIYFHLSPGGKLKKGPLWDHDLGFGNVDYSDARYAEGWWIQTNPWINRLLDDPAFVAKVKTKFEYYQNNEQFMLDKIDAYAEKLQWAQHENYSRWPTLGQYVWPNPVVFDTYQKEVDHLKQWYQDRMAWLDGAINSLEGESEAPINTSENILVTFQVDMNSVETNADGVYIAGGDLGQNGYLMSDNGSDIWSVTLELAANTRHTYKFRNQPPDGTWSGFESSGGLGDGGCGTGTWNDRFIDVGDSDMVLNVVAYGSCTANPV